MILHVEFDQFAPTVERLLHAKEAYIRHHGGTTVVSAAQPDKHAVVASSVRETVEHVRSRLEKEGFEVHEGEWTDAGESPADRLGDRQCYIAAVSYVSREKMPGLWLDAYPAEPVTGSVLRAFYDELEGNGEIAEVSFEEFIRLANPNVVIIGPSEIQSYLNDKENC